MPKTLLHAGSLAAVCLVAASCTANVDGSSDEGPTLAPEITTSNVVSRAQEWVNAGLHYCQSAYEAVDGDNACWAWEGASHRCRRESNEAWNKYRSDCSGFVTFAWGLPPVGDGGYVTGDFAPFDNSFSHAIAPDDLQPGDALNLVTNEHIVLFVAWIDKGHSARFMEEPGCSASEPYAHEFTSDVTFKDGNVVIAYEGSTPFTPIRFDGIQQASTVPTVRLVVGSNADGRLELFYIDGDHKIRHIWETAPSSRTWSAPSVLPGDAKTLALGKNSDGRLELFYAGTDDTLYHDWQLHPNGSWAGQHAMGGAATQLAVANHPDGRIELFYLGTDDAVYHNYEQTTGGWSGQHALGGKGVHLAAGVNADGRIEIFYVGTDEKLYHNWQTAPDGSWNGEAGFGGKAKQVAVSTNADGKLDVVYIGTDRALYHNAETVAGPWSGERSLGGEAKQLVTANDSDGGAEVFYIGTDDALYHNYQHGANGDWNGQASLGGKALALAADRNADGRVTLLFVGTNVDLYQNEQMAPSSGWRGASKVLDLAPAVH
jgi:acylphosphatase